MNFCKKSENTYNRSFSSSVKNALEGVVHTLKAERNMRVHFLAGFFVLIVGVYLNLNAIEFMALLFAITFVLVAEMMNTAIEYSADLISTEYDPKVKLIKDIAAGAVFVSAMNSMVVGYILLAKRIDWHMTGTFSFIKQSPWSITLIVFLIVVGLVLFVKIIRKEENLLCGGMPSGHSAVAFSVWVIISMFTENVLASVLVFFLAVIVARSRIVSGIHTLWEIIAGSVLGTLVTVLVVQLLS